MRLIGPPFRCKATIARLWQDQLQPGVDAKVITPILPAAIAMHATEHLVIYQEPLEGDAAAVAAMQWLSHTTPRLHFFRSLFPNILQPS